MSNTRLPGDQRLPARGYSLIELIIVMAIIGLVMAAMLQSMLGIRQYASTAEVEDDLNIEAQRIMMMLREDLGASGWYLPEGSPELTTDLDRGDLYFPYVQVQDAVNNKLGTRFPQHNRVAYTTKDWVTVQHYVGLPGSQADATAATLSDTAYKTSFYAKSQEIIFLKVWQGGFSATGVDRLVQPIDFADKNGVTYSGLGNEHNLGFLTMDDYARGTLWDATAKRWYRMDGSLKIFDVDSSGTWLQPPITTPVPYDMDMSLRWESMTRYPNMTVATTAAPPAIDLREIREYSYVVVPNPGNANRGQLVRAYKKPSNSINDSAGNATLGATSSDWVLATGDYKPYAASSAMPSTLVVDRVISDKVDRITFDTYRTDQIPDPNNAALKISGLEINQIRVRIFLSKKSSVDTGAPQKRIIEATIALRSTSDSSVVTNLTPMLGRGGSVVLH
jgi:prepilin-type N-terminal cleavage/methylation domain-containing protein